MFSPGQWWKEIPKGQTAAGALEHRRYRQAVREGAIGSQKRQKELLARCKDDLLFYVNTFVWTYDPRTFRGKIIGAVPFQTYPYQDEAFLEILSAIEEGEDLVIEKSRDMGASWMSLVVMEWLWHFHAGTSFLILSRKKDMVDKTGDPDSLFWKIDMLHRFLPRWLRPRIERLALHFGNLDLGTTIDGDATTEASSVGGRRTAVFVDEFSRFRDGYQILAGTADVTTCRIFNFTPFGTNNAAYKLAKRSDVRKVRLHWSQHPDKAAGLYQYSDKTNRVEAIDKSYSFPPDYEFIRDGKLRSPWYDREWRRRANPLEIAQMLDIDYMASNSPFFEEGRIRWLQDSACRPAYWEGELEGADGGRARLVRRKGGPLKLWVNPRADGTVPAGPHGLGADLSWGTGATPSCISIGNASTAEKVAEYTSAFLAPQKMAEIAVALAWLFADAIGEPARMAWERQGPGVPFGRRLLELGFRNIYYQRDERSNSTYKPSDVPGWNPTNDNRALLLDAYREALASGAFVNRSAEALEECLDFRYVVDGTVRYVEDTESRTPTGQADPAKARINHGDHVIADALCLKMMRERGVPEEAIPFSEKIQVGTLAWRRQLAEAKREQEEAWI